MKARFVETKGFTESIAYQLLDHAYAFYMLDLYGKDEKDDLTMVEKKQLRHLSEILKKEAAENYKA